MRILRKSLQKTNIKNLKHKFYVIDTETTCLEPMPKNFVFGCLYGHSYKKTFYSVEDFIKEFDNKKYKDKFIFAHNAEFDLLTIFGNIYLKIDNSAIFNGKFISAKYKDIIFCDSMNIYPTSVAKLGNLIGLSKLENEKAKKGKLRVNNITKEDVDYCIRDCEIVFKALLKIFEMTGAIKTTLPSLAMYNFRHDYLETDMQFSELVDNFYESYYGGRTEAFYIGNCNAKVYDINSMYPKAMATVILPDIKHLYKTENCDISFLNFCLKNYQGMCKVTVIHSETFFGYLPCKMKINGVNKLVFPVGEFTTTVNFNELNFAINQNVVKIKKVHYIVYGNPIPNIFTNYILETFKKRQESKTELEKTIYKLKMNSLYGRFAMRMKLTTTYWESIPYKLISMMKETEKYCDIKLFNSQRADCFLITENEKFKNSFFSIPAISSYITSEARITLLKSLLSNSNNNVIYCDTDSIFVERGFVGNLSSDLGDFKLEEKKITQVRGLKNYTYEDIEGKKHIIIKGVSWGSIAKETSIKGEISYSSQKYYKTKASLRQNKEPGAAYTMVKIVRNNYDKREVLSNGQTKPLICKLVQTKEGTSFVLINATKFLRTKIDIARLKREKAFRYEPQNVKEAVMMFFITGGQVYTKHLIDYVTGSSKEELKSYKGLHSMQGIHMDVFHEIIPDAFYTDRMIDVFQDVLLTYNKVEKMQEYLEKNKLELEQSVVNNKFETDFEYDTPF